MKKSVLILLMLISLFSIEINAQENYIGEIKAFSFDWAPMEWLSCNGQTLAINQYSALFSLIGTRYGGNGTTTFCLPNLNGKVIVGSGTNNVVGQIGGSQTTTLTTDNLPAHSHTATLTATANMSVNGSAGTANVASARVNVLAGSSTDNIYSNNAPNVTLNAGSNNVTGTVTVANQGNGQAFSNMQPYCVLNYCICVNGLYPVRQ